MSNSSPHSQLPGWMPVFAFVCGVYHLLWGLFGLIWPAGLFQLTGMPSENAVFFWQGNALFLLTFGGGYLIASGDLLSHWLVLVMGTFTKVTGFVGTIAGVLLGWLAPLWLLLAIANELIWLTGMLFILWTIFYLKQPGGTSETPEVDFDLWDDALDQQGTSLGILTQQRPVLLTFLRHAGCVFCREALDDIQRRRQEIEVDSAIAFVHMGQENAQTQQFFAQYHLEDVPRFSDPDRKLYRAFELKLGRLSQLFGWRVWVRGARAFFTGGHSVGTLQGNGFQMSGAFLLHNRQILKEFRHQDAADRPDYCKLASSESTSPAPL